MTTTPHTTPDTTPGTASDTTPRVRAQVLPWQQPAAEPAPRFMTIDEIAAFLHISKWMVYAQINQKKLKTVTIGARRLVTPEDLQHYVEQLRTEEGGFHG